MGSAQRVKDLHGPKLLDFLLLIPGDEGITSRLWWKKTMRHQSTPVDFFLNLIHATLACKANWGVEFLDKPVSITEEGKEKQGKRLVIVYVQSAVTCPKFRSGILYFPRMDHDAIII